MNEPENQLQENYFHTESLNNEDLFIPPKPIPPESKSTIRKSLISIALFIAIFYLVFKFDLLMILILAGIILIHELGHYLAMKIFNYKDLSIFFVPLIGAYASGSKDQVSQRQKVLILLAGPVPGIIIGMVLSYFGFRYDQMLLAKTANIFIVLNLFNLIPVYPLDGGQLLKTMFFNQNHVLQMIFMVISILLLAGWAIYKQSWYFLLIPALLVGQMMAQIRIHKSRKELKEKGLNLDKTYDDLTDREYWDIRETVIFNNKLFEDDLKSGKYEISPREGQILGQVKNVIYKEPVRDLGIIGKINTLIFWLLCFIIPVLIYLFRFIQR